jgi:hypothetical protein
MVSKDGGPPKILYSLDIRGMTSPSCLSGALIIRPSTSNEFGWFPAASDYDDVDVHVYIMISFHIHNDDNDDDDVTFIMMIFMMVMMMIICIYSDDFLPLQTIDIRDLFDLCRSEIHI